VYPGPLYYPLVRGVHQFFELGIGQHAFRHGHADAQESCPYFMLHAAIS
jgi:hypothetical protein